MRVFLLGATTFFFVIMPAFTHPGIGFTDTDAYLTEEYQYPNIPGSDRLRFVIREGPVAPELVPPDDYISLIALRRYFRTTYRQSATARSEILDEIEYILGEHEESSFGNSAYEVKFRAAEFLSEFKKLLRAFLGHQ